MSKEESPNQGILKALSVVGSQKLLALKIGCAQSTVSDWLNGKKRVSPQYVPVIVKAANGEVMAHQLRPDLPDLFPDPTDAEA
ncbi:helix-turn-helix domain-containing protein [Serratia sp. 1D1416]|uniref:helix-turn-helix domain-containing protein n=1 Tax=Serratia sp. 1D1416 TaxID=2447890 RepID=UPI001013CF9B|nr:helix-turn-helix domain-containing protein [Serratia sp. 1D1416]